MVTGVDIGGTKCAVICESKGEIISKAVFATMGAAETVDKIIDEISRLVHPEAIGISCGGPLDSERGVILSPPNLHGWDNVEIKAVLEERFSVPVALRNDANACALAEWRFGAGVGTKNMIFLTFGTGLGAGLILDGRLYEGTNGNAGEVGHIRLSDYGPCGYGKIGSFEGFCSGGGIAKLAKMRAEEKLQMGKSVSYCRSFDDMENITAKTVAIFAEENDDAAEIYRECGRMLGRGLSVLIDILNPEMIVIGSVYQRSEKLLCEEMNKVIKREALFASQSVVKIVPAMLKEEIGDYAAISVAHEVKESNKWKR